MALQLGTRLGPYEIQSAIGAGGMGEVYRATDTSLGRQVAIKVLPDTFAQDPERLARFEREAKTLASLNHPNIAIIHGLEKTDRIRALVMELVEGPNPDTSHDSARQAFVGIGLRWLRVAGTTLYLALALASVIYAPVIATQTNPWPSTREHDLSSGSDEVTSSAPAHSVTIFLGGDVMTGRGIDQILPRPSHPRIYESFVQDARDYVGLAERANGPIPSRVAFSYVWGDAIEELHRVGPAARIVNVETSVTRSDDYWVGKGINYRMHPSNVPTLTSARIDVAVLANNHVLDYGPAGLQETLDTLRRAGVSTAGAGRDLAEAQRPAIVELSGQARLIVLAFGLESSGIPTSWAARWERPGISFLGGLSQLAASTIIERVKQIKRPNDLVVVSFHWGDNWGYEVPAEHVRFAHWLIDGGVDIIHGHSSHHPRPVEVYRNRLILYGCGDLLNDYEGIAGFEEFRNDLALMYFVSVSPTGELLGLRMMPMQIRKFRLNRGSATDAQWLRDTLDRVSRPFGSRIRLQPDASLALEWP